MRVMHEAIREWLAVFLVAILGRVFDVNDVKSGRQLHAISPCLLGLIRRGIRALA
jgi:hypothetical protein